MAFSLQAGVVLNICQHGGRHFKIGAGVLCTAKQVLFGERSGICPAATRQEQVRVLVSPVRGSSAGPGSEYVLVELTSGAMERQCPERRACTSVKAHGCTSEREGCSKAGLVASCGMQPTPAFPFSLFAAGHFLHTCNTWR